MRKKGLNKNLSETNYNTRFKSNNLAKGSMAKIEEQSVNNRLAKHQNFLKNLGVDEKHLPDSLVKDKKLDARGYDKVMDEHALHVFMIRKGKIIQETPEFLSFKRVIGKDLHRIVPFLLTLEQFASF